MTVLGPRQQFAIDFEATIAVGFIQQGVVALGDLDGGNDFRQLPMQLLSIGLERFFKLTIALAEFEQLGALPASMKQCGHNLSPLLPRLVRVVTRSASYVARPACSDDLDFLTTDADLGWLLRTLSTYAQQGRYHHLETVLGQAAPPDPDDEWRQIERRYLDGLPHWKAKMATPEFAGFYTEMAGCLTGTVQRCARALSRMWTLGPLGETGRRYTGVVQPFLSIGDADLRTPSRRRS